MSRRTQINNINKDNYFCYCVLNVIYGSAFLNLLIGTGGKRIYTHIYVYIFINSMSNVKFFFLSY